MKRFNTNLFFSLQNSRTLSVLAIKKYFSLFIVTLVALQILNFGLYAQEFSVLHRDAYGCKPNIINSVTEYIAEVVMKKNNAFPERRERPNQSDHNPVYKFQPFKIYASNSNAAYENEIALSHNYAGFIVPAYSNHTTDITSPPPKAIAQFGVIKPSLVFISKNTNAVSDSPDVFFIDQTDTCPSIF